METKMKPKTIKVLLLEDMGYDFSKIEDCIKEISNELRDKGIQLELLYNFDCSLKLISNFVASKKMTVNLRKPFKDIVSSKVDKINNESMLICILDIVWTKDAKSKEINRGGKRDEYGCDFYYEYLTNNDIKQNTIIVSALSKSPEQMQDMQHVSKVYRGVPFGNDFKVQLKEAICRCPIVGNNINNDINPHIEND
jgi:hypothetical protein